jgi:hypothetical protein
MTDLNSCAKQIQKKVLQIHAKLAYALGYAKEPFIYNIVATQTAPYPSPMLFESKQMFVYADIVEPQLVGDTQVPLLRICIPSRLNNYSDYMTEKYIRPYYLRRSTFKFELTLARYFLFQAERH